MSGGSDFLAEHNVCGQTLLKLVSRGNSIIAELNRMSGHIPAALTGEDELSARRYAPVLFDFRYLKTPEMFEKAINTDAEKAELDEEFFVTHEHLLSRFYSLFEAICRFHSDFRSFLSDLAEGFYITQTVSSVLLDPDGKQLACEALFLLGVMLLLLDRRIPGPARERLIVAWYRHKGESSSPSAVPITDLSALCRDTGFNPAEANNPAKRPADYPCSFFARCPLPAEFISMALARLRGDDIYSRLRVYPSPEHASFALSSQASLLFVALFFSPRTLQEEKKEMREAVDKFFSDNWVVPVYMGTLLDLSVEWSSFKAARDALAQDICKPETVKALAAKHKALLMEADKSLNHFLTEGVLTEPFLVESMPAIMEHLRTTNTSLQWVLLHEKTANNKLREPIVQAFGLSPSAASSSSVPGGGQAALLDLMLRVALLEHRLKSLLARLLKNKAEAWSTHQQEISAMMTELSETFSGQKALSKVEKDEDLMVWFRSLATEISSLDYRDAVVAGRKIRQMIRGLEDVSQFDAIDASASVRDFISLAKTALKEMVKGVNITDATAADIDIITDFSFAWELIRAFVPGMHARLAKDPSAVAILRTLFLKLGSVLDVPLLRITQANSKDELSVAQLYSGQLLTFLRNVLAVIPSLVFSTLESVIAMQTNEIRPIPIRFELSQLRDHAQLELRRELARKTHSISVFAEGVLTMKKTLLGIVRVDPRAILNDGIRKQLVERISETLHVGFVFDGSTPISTSALASATSSRSSRLAAGKVILESQLGSVSTALSGFRRSFEYCQDYLGIHGLRMWQEELTRIIAFNTEQECNKYLRKKVLPDESRYQSSSIKIPLFLGGVTGGKSKGKASILTEGSSSTTTTPALTFMGRLTEALLALTQPQKTRYGPGCTGGVWCEPSGKELAGLGLFSLLNSSVGVSGLVGIDRLLSFSIGRSLSAFAAVLSEEATRGFASVLPRAGSKGSDVGFQTALKNAAKPLDRALTLLLEIGQIQLLRRAIAHELQFKARAESSLLSNSLEALNVSLLADVREFYSSSEGGSGGGASAGAGAEPSGGSGSGSSDSKLSPHVEELLPSVTALCEAGGLSDPLSKIYTLMGSHAFLAEWLFLCTLLAASKLTFDEEFGSLGRKKEADLIDGPPFVAGVVTLLKQLHPETSHRWFSLVGEFVRDRAGPHSAPPLAPLKTALSQLTEQVAKMGRVPVRVLHLHLSPYE